MMEKYVIKAVKNTNKNKIPFKHVFESALVATLSMSVYMRIIGGIKRKQLKIVNVLGTLLLGKRIQEQQVAHSVKAIATGMTTHLSIGTTFVFSYYLLWKNQLVKPNFKNGLLLGLINGLIGIGGWEFLFRLSSHFPRIDKQSYFLHIFLAHALFGIVASESFRKLQKG